MRIIGELVAQIRGTLRGLYDWVVSWADRPHSEIALFLIAFAESSFFPIPPDVLLIAMGVSVPRRALRFAAICLAGSVLGGAMGYALGIGLWAVLKDPFFAYVPGFTPELFETVSGLYQENAFLAIFTAGFTPIPYKIFTIAAGVTGLSFWPFVLASLVGRGSRFFLVGALLRVFGAKFKVAIEKHFDWLSLLFVVLLVGGITVLKVLF